MSMGAMITGMGPLYAALFNTSLSTFFPHLTLGIIFWSFISGAIGEGCYTYIHSASYIKQAPYSRSIFSWRIIAKHFIYLAHHVILFIPVAIWAQIKLNLNTLLFFPALGLTLLNLHLLAITLGFVSARFRDVPQIVASILQLLMFLTPVFWLPESLPGRSRFILYNPLAAHLDLLRAPLMGIGPASTSWSVVFLFTVANIFLAAITYVRSQRRVVYWL
jgi:ABC-type polysaccharide/polyol phosphate export permease